MKFRLGKLFNLTQTGFIASFWNILLKRFWQKHLDCNEKFPKPFLTLTCRLVIKKRISQSKFRWTWRIKHHISNQSVSWYEFCKGIFHIMIKRRTDRKKSHLSVGRWSVCWNICTEIAISLTNFDYVVFYNCLKFVSVEMFLVVFYRSRWSLSEKKINSNNIFFL